MISKGTQYLSAAGFGNIRVTAASMGSLDILGTWHWLNGATQQAILGAFGARDGAAVIAATNAYLNALAATDRTKATALAALINEDPMMVCSLGLEVQGVAMPIRWLVGDGGNGTNGAYINTGWIPKYDTALDIEFYLPDSTSTHRAISRCDDGNGTKRFGVSSDGNLFWAYGQNYHYGPSSTVGLWRMVTELNVCKVYNEGTLVQTITAPALTSLAITLEMPLFARKSPGLSQTSNMKCRYEIIKDGNSEVRHFIPMKLGKAWAAGDVSTGVAQAAGTCGMIDLVSGKFFPNANSSGSFTIPDISYTPSTP